MNKQIESLLNIIEGITDFDEFREKKDLLLQKLRSFDNGEELSVSKQNDLSKNKDVLATLLSTTPDNSTNHKEELISKARELKGLLNTLPVLVFFKDLELKYVLVNEAYSSFTGLGNEEIVGKNTGEVISDYNSLINYSGIEQEVINSAKAVYNIEEEFARQGKVSWVSTNLAPVKSDNGQVIGLIGVSWNITEQRNYEIQLQKSKNIAEEGTRVKNQFLANISHEIRTPLNGIIGMSQILTKTDLGNKQKEYLDILINSSDSLLSLVNDILDFSKIEAGQSELELNDFNLKELLIDVSNIIENKAEEKGLEFKLEIGTNVPEFVNGDNYKLKQIILNLAKNAIKFTNKGMVKILVSTLESTKKYHRISFKVSDTGIGIKQNNIGNLFEGFSQLDPTTTRNYGGTGLGLAISKKLVEMMDGEISASSRFGEGSEFTFQVKLLAAKERNLFSNIEDLTPKSHLSVLLAEDNLVNQKITEFSIKQIGYNIDIANNGLEAIEKYRNNVYHFILMDLQMPIMNGFDATIEIRKIQEADTEREHIPIIALTANATKEDRRRSFDAGMDGFMSKPFNPIELRKLLVKLSVL